MDPISILLSIFFSAIGVGAWRYGRRTGQARHMVLGVGLIGYSWLIDDPLYSFLVGAVLTVLLVYPK